MNKKISFFSLAILIISGIDNMKNMPSAALFGSSLLFFFAISAILFLIPTAFISAKLSATFPDKGGVYHWVEKAFGKRWGMTAIWLQWINTMVWYPTMLSFIAGTLAYLIDPKLAENKIYLISTILILFWALTWINLRGIHASTKLTNICSLIGTILPMCFLVGLGVMWVLSGEHLQINFTGQELIPSLSHTESWGSLIAVMASFLGMELSGVHVNDVGQPQKNFPKAISLAVLFIFLSMSLSSLSIAVVLPKEEINLISGVMQVFQNFFEVFGFTKLTPLLAFSIALGSVGTMVNWLISPAKGLLHAAEFGFLPPFFAQKNRAGVASNILLAQAILVTLFSLIFLLGPGVNLFFWFLTALSTELYMVMYLLMFCAGLKLHYNYNDLPTPLKIFGKNWTVWLFSLLGLVGSLMTIVVSFFPPEGMEIEHPLGYVLMIGLGNVVTMSPLILFFLHQKKRRVVHPALTEGVDTL